MLPQVPTASQRCCCHLPAQPSAWNTQDLALLSHKLPVQLLFVPYSLPRNKHSPILLGYRVPCCQGCSGRSWGPCGAASPKPSSHSGAEAFWRFIPHGAHPQGSSLLLIFFPAPSLPPWQQQLMPRLSLGSSAGTVAAHSGRDCAGVGASSPCDPQTMAVEPGGSAPITAFAPLLYLFPDNPPPAKCPSRPSHCFQSYLQHLLPEWEQPI